MASQQNEKNSGRGFAGTNSEKQREVGSTSGKNAQKTQRSSQNESEDYSDAEDIDESEQ